MGKGVFDDMNFGLFQLVRTIFKKGSTIPGNIAISFLILCIHINLTFS